MTQSGNVVGAQPPVWTVGALSADELERLAGEIRPAWEVGLDAVNDSAGAAVAAAIVPSANGFAPAPARLAADLGSMSHGSQAASMSVAAAVPQPNAPPKAAPPPPSPARAVGSAKPIASQPVPAVARSWDEEPVAAPGKSKGVLFGGIAGAVVLVGAIAFFALRSGGDTTPAAGAPLTTTQASTATVVPTTALMPNAEPNARPTTAVIPPSAAAPVAATPMAPTAPIEPVAMAAEPPAPSSHHGHHATAAAPPPPPPPVHVAAAPVARPAAPAPAHHSSASHASHRVRGAGFVTDSPY